MDEKDYLDVLEAIDEIPFPMGKNLLADFLRGDETNKSINKNKLYFKETFGILAYSKEELHALIDSLIINNLIRIAASPQNPHWKLLVLTEKGRQEMKNPTLFKKKLANQYEHKDTNITDEDRKMFAALGPFLQQYNDEQKKAIICPAENVLCIAGAGSGKTTVLTKRIEFLVKYKSVDPRKILAITFTRKARQEMQSRLLGVPCHVETFNSFCEKILKQYNDLVYEKPVRVISYRDKMLMISKALNSVKIGMIAALQIYFTSKQRRNKTDEKLMNVFMNDIFFIRDYFAFKHKHISPEEFIIDPFHEESAKLVFSLSNYIDAYMKKHGLRDFADQLIDALDLFKKYPDKIPKYDYILVDEFQDVNSTQVEFIDILSPKNLFAVGDPRQSIYGWRGSDVRFILNFEEKYKNSERVALTKNYRSTKAIVDLINVSIEQMQLPDLEAVNKGKRNIRLLRFDAEPAEFEFVLQGIINAKVPKNEIFVLARTNRQLNDFSLLLKQRNISHILRNEDSEEEVMEGKVTLATVHGIKGMEAEMVFVIGCTQKNYPCKGSEHPVVDMVKVDEYDKEEEERRLFYVALSRARTYLYMSYSGKKHTYFINDKMANMVHE